MVRASSKLDLVFEQIVMMLPKPQAASRSQESNGNGKLKVRCKDSPANLQFTRKV